MHQKDPEVWWNTFEVNIRGAYNFFRCARVSFFLVSFVQLS